jgi:Phosphopantetheine attachment site.
MTRFEKVQGLIQKAGKGKVAVEKIVPAADLRSDLGLDSLAMMELLVLTEEAFGLTYQQRGCRGDQDGR